MILHIETFAILADKLGKQFILNLPEESRVSDLVAHLKKANDIPTLRVVKDNIFMNDDTPLQDGDQIFLLPPSSGG